MHLEGTAKHGEEHNEGHNEGDYAGHNAGHNEGHSEGMMKGHTEGHNEGHKEGHNKGHNEGHNEGHKEGHNEGQAATQAESFTQALAASTDCACHLHLQWDYYIYSTCQGLSWQQGLQPPRMVLQIVNIATCFCYAGHTCAVGHQIDN